MPKGYGFPVANKILKRSDQDRAFRLHRHRVETMRTNLDNSPPKRHPHLVLRLKQTQMEEEYLANVDYENKLLLQKMVRIMEKPRNGMDNWNDYEAKSLNAPYKTRRNHKIEQENLAMARRLEAVRPMYSIERWEEDHKRNKYFQELWAEGTKDYSPRRGKDRQSVNGSKAEDEYEDDFESDGESGKLPDINKDKDSKAKDRRGSKSNSSVQRLPKIHSRKQNPKLYMYWGRYYNADSDQSEDGKPSQAEQDAKQLFRVAKTLAPPTDIVVRTLIRRTPKQREMIKKKFNEMYELDLSGELKNGLGKQWHLLIDALLPPSKEGDGDKNNDDEDADGPENTLHSALEVGDIPRAVKIIVSKSDKELADLKEAYESKHEKTLDQDIIDRTQDPKQLFLLHLIKENKSAGKKDMIQKDAEAIYEQEDGRWTSPDGEFMNLLETRTNAHVRAVLKKYEEISGTAAVKAIKEECSKGYADAVAAFLTDTNKGGDEGQGSSDKAMDHAIVLYKNLNAENAVFVNLLVERAEIDMPTIRKAYSKKYKSEVHTDLEDRSRHPTVRCLVELILKVPPSQGKDKDQGQDKQGDRQRKGRGENKRGQEGGQGQGQGQGQNKDKPSPLGQSSKKSPAEKTKKKKTSAESKAEEDAEKLHTAMEKKELTAKFTLDIIFEINNSKRQLLKKKYKEKYKEDLPERLKKELSGDDLEDVVVGLLMPPIEYDSYCLNKAVKGLGTNEDVLIGILCTASPKELSSIKEHYKKNYGEDLDSAIRGDTSGGFEDMLLALSKGERNQGTSVNDKEAKEVAKKLFNKKKLDMDDPIFMDLMTKSNKEQMKATFKEYKKLSGKTMEQAIKDASSGDEEDGFLGLLAASNDPVTFYADSLQKAFKGAGTNDDQLMRIVISRSEVDLPAIKAKYEERHKRPLRKAIEDETSGEYRDALLRIVDKIRRRSDDEDGTVEDENGRGKQDEETRDTSEEAPDKTSDGRTNKTRPGRNPDHTGNGSSSENKTTKSKTTGNEKTNIQPSRTDDKSPKANLGSKTSNSKTTNEVGQGHSKSKPGLSKGKSDQEKQKKPKSNDKAVKDKAGKPSQKKGERDKEKLKESKMDEDTDEQTETTEEEAFDASEDVVKLHDAMKGLGTDEKAIIEVITSRSSGQRQKIRQAFADKYNEDLMSELNSELSGDFRNLALDLMRLPWERELQVLISSMAGAGTNEDLLVHVLLTHEALSMADLSKKFKDAEKTELAKAVDSDTSGHLRRILQGVLKAPQKADKKTADDVAKRLYNGGKPLLQSKPAEAIDLLTSCPTDKMADVTASYKKLSNRELQEDIRTYLSGEAEDALLALVAFASDPETHKDDMLRRSLEGEITFRIFSLIICSKEDDLLALQERYQTSTGRSLKNDVQKELRGDVRSLVQAMLARATPEDDKE